MSESSLTSTRPAEVDSLFHKFHADYVFGEWECHANAGFCGISKGERQLFASVDVTFGEAAFVCLSMNAMPHALHYIKELEGLRVAMYEALKAQEAHDKHRGNCAACGDGDFCETGAELSYQAQKLRTLALSKAEGRE